VVVRVSFGHLKIENVANVLAVLVNLTIAIVIYLVTGIIVSGGIITGLTGLFGATIARRDSRTHALPTCLWGIMFVDTPITVFVDAIADGIISARS
jgi:hypothetical protein